MKLVKKLSPIGENHQHSATRNVGDVGSIDLPFSSFVKYDLCISYEMWRMTAPSQEVANATLMFHGISHGNSFYLRISLHTKGAFKLQLA